MNYQESNVTGTVYTRAFKIVIDNALGQNPSIHYQQEQVANLDGGEHFQKLVGSVSVTLTPDNAQTVFPLIHPITGDLLGEATYEQFQLILYSLYLHTAAIAKATVVL